MEFPIFLIRDVRERSPVPSMRELTSPIILGSCREAATSPRLLTGIVATRRTDHMEQKDKSGDQIHIAQLEVSARVGVPEEERASAQRLTFTISLWPLEEFHHLDDQIARTVDYASVCTETREFVATRRDKLIETLADALARHLLEVFEIRRITVELRKYILPNVEFVSVTVTRDRTRD